MQRATLEKNKNKNFESSLSTVILMVRTGFKALHNVRSKLLHRRAIMDGYVFDQAGYAAPYPPYQGNN